MNLKRSEMRGLWISAGSLLVTVAVCTFARDSVSSQELQARLRLPKMSYIQTALARDTGVSEGFELMSASDCYTCHAEYKIVLAPSFSDIAGRYKKDKAAVPTLVSKVISGTVGNWGDKPMPAHPELLREDVQKMLAYIMSLNAHKDSTKLILSER